MKKLIITLILIAGLSTGCSTFHSVKERIFGKSVKAEIKAQAAIDKVEDRQDDNNIKRLKEIGEFSYGVEFTLDKINSTNDIKEVKVAYDLNNRIQTLAEKPDINAVKEMQKIVNEMLTNNFTALNKKDKEISALEKEIIKLAIEHEQAVAKYMQLAEKTAAQQDANKSELDKMNSWGGLGAIWYGIRRLIVRMAWGIGIFSVLFIILRLLSYSNPVAASVFSIFSRMGSWVINIVAAIVPKAVSTASLVSKKLYDESRLILTKIVDQIQFIKETEKRTGKDFTVKELLVEISKTMDDSQKAEITKIQKDLGY